MSVTGASLPEADEPIPCVGRVGIDVGVGAGAGGAAEEDVGPPTATGAAALRQT